MKKMSVADCQNVSGKAGLILKTLFEGESTGDDSVRMGYAVFSPGLRVPESGAASHDGDEYAYIISGSIKGCAGGETQTLVAGDVSFIPAGEAHYSYNDGDQDCVLVYLMVKRRDR